jgi:MoaA/NifB/PqqE/SkfB family radical SAM enzyme
VEISPGKFALYGTDAKWTGSVVLSKNMRGLVSRRTTKGPAAMTRHEACKDCPKLAACGACFIIVDDRRPEKGVKVAGLKAVPPESIHEQCKAGNSRILISGYSTVCVFTDPDTTPPLHRVPAFEPWETADAAALHEFGVIDYDLDRDPMTGEWSLLLGRDAPALSREGRGIAVLQLSSACVARCVMCAMPIQFAGRWVNTVDSARLMEELYLLGYRTCDIFGGEITMRPDFLFLMALAKEVGMRAFFITTGHSLDAAKVDALASAGVDKCSVALDAKSPGLNDRIKGRPGLHGWAVKAVNLLLADGRIPLEVNTVLMSQNAHEMEALNRELARMGVERHRIFYCIDVLMGMGEPPYLTKRQALNFVKKTHPALEKASKRRGTLVDWCPPVEIGKRKPEEDAERISKGIYTDVSISCSAPDRELFITVDGLIYPCLNPTVFTLEPVGEVGRGKLADVLRGKRFQEFSNMAGKMPPCANCISKRAYTGRGDR